MKIFSPLLAIVFIGNERRVDAVGGGGGSAATASLTIVVAFHEKLWRGAQWIFVGSTGESERMFDFILKAHTQTWFVAHN